MPDTVTVVRFPQIIENPPDQRLSRIALRRLLGSGWGP
jgi:hypothetical protein